MGDEKFLGLSFLIYVRNNDNVSNIIIQKVSIYEPLNSNLLFTISQILRDTCHRAHNTVFLFVCFNLGGFLAFKSKFLFGLTRILLCHFKLNPRLETFI